ncbi:MAG TPA: winged helix-turn-helix domain-containing protein [Candidatus Dormibacteraeota bacterium]
MANAMIAPAATNLYLIPGEMPDSDDPEDARQWVTIYRELVAFAERSLTRLRAEAANGFSLGEGHGDADVRWMEAHLGRLRTRLEFWEQRFWRLAGLDLDIHRRVLSHGGHRLRLTRRETELLAYLAQRPGQFYAASQLVQQAWHAPELSEEQLRTYVVRIRRHLATAQVPARLVSEPRRGYGLVFSG